MKINFRFKKGFLFHSILELLKELLRNLSNRHCRFCILFSLIIILQCCFLIFPYSQDLLPDSDELVSLSGEWQISLEDQDVFSTPDFDDSGWDAIDLPGSMLGYALEKKNRIDGICWVRKRISIKKSDDPDRLGLILGRIGDADETYFNGVLVGSMGAFPPDDFSMWNHPRNYQIPEKLINYGAENVIAIRISYFNYCEILGEMAVTSFLTWEKYNVSSVFFNITTGYIAITIGVVLFFLSSLVYFSKPRSEEYLYYTIAILCGLFPIIETCIYWDIYPDRMFRYKLLAVSATALHISHSFFLHRLYNLERKKVERLLKVYIGLILFGCAIYSNEKLFRVFGVIFLGGIICMILYNFSCSITALIDKKPYAKAFSFFGAIFILFVANDYVIYFAKFSTLAESLLNHKSFMTAQFGAIFLYMGSAVIMARRFINIADDVDMLNSKLEAYIVQNLRLNRQLNIQHEPVKIGNSPDNKVSSQVKKKIDMAIEYIHDNYCSSITRLELADFLGIHPDNLGKNFKKYAGKKLSDYITELRVNEAARRLRVEDTNVIDIAFDSGFESLRTFQRLFPKYMGVSPEKYRKNYQKSDM